MDKKFKCFKLELERIYKSNKIYREKMKRQKITPDDINSWKDIKKLPITTKQDLLKDYPNGWSCVPTSEIKMYHASSGTTGKPLIVGLTENDLQFRKKVMIEDAKEAGITPDDTIQICYGFGMFTGGFSFYEGVRDYGCKIIPTGTMSTEMQLLYMNNLKPTVLITSPSHVMHLYEKAKEENIDVKKLPIRIIRVGSELLTESMRKKIKEAWGENVSVTQDYGMTETLGPGLGMECKFENGMHLNPNYYFELVDPVTKKPTKKKVGELVVTTIYNECFPIIRYATSDLVEISKESCPCGCSSPRITRFLGRSDDMLKVKGESMINAGILDGDMVLVEEDNTASNGDMVVALVDDSATVKTFYKEEGVYRLQPENDFMDPIIVKEVSILGKVIGVIRLFK